MAENSYFRIKSSKDTFFTKFKGETISLGLNIKQIDGIFKLMKQLLAENYEASKVLLEKHPSKADRIIQEVFQYSHYKLEDMDSITKRFNDMNFSSFNVEVDEVSSGYRWERTIDKNTGNVISKTVQSTFQLVPISKTLKALFSYPQFEQFYMKFNENKVHICEEGVYRSFCCGNIYEKNEFLKSNPLAIQIRLFTDDFDPCDALKSKAGIHKMTTYYFDIRNLPPQVLSKIGNIHLVALSDAIDSKNECSNTNNVLEVILNDIKFIETFGINTSSNLNLKGTVVSFLFDNLGGNILYALSGGFNANHYCRICESSKAECQQMTQENTYTMRDKNKYNEIIAQLLSDSPPDLTAAKGIKSYCPINYLNYFHIMHDIFEGVGAFALEEVFGYCINHKIATFQQIQSMVHCYNFGVLSKKNIPSKINLDKKNLGQNASQALCLILHIPYILSVFKNELENVWDIVTTLLQIIQIVMSKEIKESDINRLAELIQKHLMCMKTYFNKRLKPKHHFLLHYPTVIRQMGPVIYLWTMRMEGKHQYFKQIANQTKSFVNIKKTLAKKHQEKIFVDKFNFCGDIEIGKYKSPFVECVNFDKYYDILKNLNPYEFVMEEIENAVTVNYIRINDRKYKQGLLIISDLAFLEIEQILVVGTNFWFLSSMKYIVKCYDTFLNSLLIEPIHENFHVINLFDLKHKLIEKKCINNKIYVIANDLEVYKMAA